jgi:hypothetical protein
MRAAAAALGSPEQILRYSVKEIQDGVGKRSRGARIELERAPAQFSVSGVPQTLIGDDGYLSFVHVGTELVLD